MDNYIQIVLTSPKVVYFIYILLENCLMRAKSVVLNFSQISIKKKVFKISKKKKKFKKS